MGGREGRARQSMTVSGGRGHAAAGANSRQPHSSAPQKRPYPSWHAQAQATAGGSAPQVTAITRCSARCGPLTMSSTASHTRRRQPSRPSGTSLYSLRTACRLGLALVGGAGLGACARRAWLRHEGAGACAERRAACCLHGCTAPPLAVLPQQQPGSPQPPRQLPRGAPAASPAAAASCPSAAARPARPPAAPPAAPPGAGWAAARRSAPPRPPRPGAAARTGTRPPPGAGRRARWG